MRDDAPPRTLTPRDLNRATLARQLLLAREKASANGVSKTIERLAGMQAQLPKPPFVGLWTRLEPFRREELLDLVRSHAVVRATAMRGTIHLMTAKDYVALRPAVQLALRRGMQSILRGRLERLDVEALVKSARAFFGKEPRTFTELRDALAKRFPGADDERGMGFAVRMTLPLVQVPIDATWGWGGNPDFALADAWVKSELKVTPAAVAESTRALVLRYLAAFGPATIADAATWSALPAATLKPVFEELRPKLVTFRDEKKRELFDLPKAPRPHADEEAPVRFLPEFDNVLLGHADRRRIISDAHRGKIFFFAARAAAAFLVDGMVAGAWKVERVKAKATLVIEPFSPIAKGAQRALAEEGARLLRFLEEDATAFDVCTAKPSDR